MSFQYSCQWTEWITLGYKTQIQVIEVVSRLASHWTKWRFGIKLDYTQETQTDKWEWVVQARAGICNMIWCWIVFREGRLAIIIRAMCV